MNNRFISYLRIKICFDLILAITLILTLFPLFIFIGLCIKISSKGPIIYWSKRSGQYGKIFRMPKFRTMKIGSPQVASDLIIDPKSYITKVGLILRKTSLDELPQIFSIISGKMSFIGPRPALHNQKELINFREKKSITLLKPGITGLAQINGRDSLLIEEKLKLDEFYYKNLSFKLDIIIFFKTFAYILKASDIKH